jgi:signal transduction histidine kinase
VKEFLNNTIKHSNCSLVEMTILSNNNQLIIYINDNGNGFDMSEQNKNGNGLKNMISRVNDSNGNADIKSSIGEGTSLKIIWPIL